MLPSLLYVLVAIVIPVSLGTKVPFPSPNEDGSIIWINIDFAPKSAIILANPDYYLFTKENPNDKIILDLMKPNAPAIAEKAPNFNPNAPLKILCHGFQSSSDMPFPMDTKTIYLDQSTEEVPNVILVDWSKIASDYFYPRAAKNTKFVGEMTAQLIQSLIKEGLTSLDKIHMIGHSLGAHASGYTGKAIVDSGLGKISQITGLDPAGPQFCSDPNERLSPDDAEFVMTIHTDDGNYCAYLFGRILHLLEFKFGHEGAMGHADFYPNGGSSQPGCGTLSSCSHSRSHELMQESIRNPRAFVAQQCTDWDTYEAGGCRGGDEEIMGEFTPRSARGRYFLRTGQASPYSLV